MKNVIWQKIKQPDCAGEAFAHINVVLKNIAMFEEQISVIWTFKTKCDFYLSENISEHHFGI